MTKPTYDLRKKFSDNLRVFRQYYLNPDTALAKCMECEMKEEKKKDFTNLSSGVVVLLLGLT